MPKIDSQVLTIKVNLVLGAQKSHILNWAGLFIS